MKLTGVVSVLLAGLVAAKDLVEWEALETNSIEGVQAVVERLLLQGLDPAKVPEVKTLLEQHNDPFLDCGCPRGFSLFIDSTGVASCQRVCFRDNISCGTPPPTSVLGTCSGFESIPKDKCKLGQLIAGCACQPPGGGPPCGSFLYYGGNYLCANTKTGITPDVTAPGCPDRTNAFCWRVTSNTCAVLTTDEQTALYRIPCVTCDVETPFVPPCRNPCRDPCRDRDPCRFRRDPPCRRPCGENWDGFCEREDCRSCRGGGRSRDRDLARKALN